MDYSNKFSVNRAIKYGRLFSPWIQRQLLFYPLISIVISVLSIILGYTTYGIAFTALLSFIPAILQYFGSLVFGMHTDRYIETLVPATWCEKATFTVVYSLVVLPLLLNIPCHIIYWIAAQIPSVAEGNSWMEVHQLSKALSAGWLWNIVQSLIPAAVCLLALVTYSNRRILMSVVWSIVSLIGISILGGIVGFMSAVKMVKEDINSLQSNDPETIIDNLAATMQPSLIILGIAGCVILLVIVCIIFRKFRFRQV